LTARKPRTLLFALPAVGLIALVVGIALAASGVLSPLGVLVRYPWSMLAAEATTMNECVECHLPADMHDCQTCHDEHGSAAMTNVPFNVLVLLTGDVPESDYIPIHEISPYRSDGRRSHMGLLEFLAAHGVTGFESVTLASSDGGLVTIAQQDLTEQALLLPHVDGIRFAAEDQHVSTWLKGIVRIVVVGHETPLSIDGQATSIGRLLVGPQTSVTVEQTDVMLQSETDGKIRKGKTAFRVEGARLSDLVRPGFQSLVVRDKAGREHRLTAEQVRGAVLALVRDEVTLILPERGRGEWVTGVVEIEPEA